MDRAHILEGYIIALDNLDDFVKSSAPPQIATRRR